MRFCLLAIIIFFSLAVSANSLKKNDLIFKSKITNIPPNFQKLMRAYTWRPGCPVPLSDLRYVMLTYWGVDKKTHHGILIINKEIAKEVVQIFKSLYFYQFPIGQMQPMEAFKGNDGAALAANNTTSFNCRLVTGQPGIFSQHSYGRAIDINMKINPYVKGKVVLPPSGFQFVDRNKAYPGKITKGSFIYNEFVKYGWDWGGNWYDLQDYQHFEKRAHGEKRNPYGY